MTCLETFANVVGLARRGSSMLDKWAVRSIFSGMSPSPCLEAFSCLLQEESPKLLPSSWHLGTEWGGEWGPTVQHADSGLILWAFSLSSPQGRLLTLSSGNIGAREFFAAEAVLWTIGHLADPWPLTIRCQNHPEVVTTKMSPDSEDIPWGGGTRVPSWEPWPWCLLAP